MKIGYVKAFRRIAPNCARLPARVASESRPMEPITLTYYAVVCGGLGALSPRIGGLLPRLGIGAVVGLVAAGLLPLVRGLIGGP